MSSREIGVVSRSIVVSLHSFLIPYSNLKQDEWCNALVSHVIARQFWFEILLTLNRQGVGYGVVIGGCKTREIHVVLS